MAKDIKNILIVDDSSTTRKLLMFILTSAGYNIIQADNGIDAFEKLAYSDVDIIVTDLNMPQMDGFEFIKTLRENSHYRHTPIIVLTTESDELEKDRCIKIGASSYLVKPITNSVLLNEINKYA